MSLLDDFNERVDKLKTKLAISENKKEEYEEKLKKYDIDSVKKADIFEKKLTKETEELKKTRNELEYEIDKLLSEYED